MLRKVITDAREHLQVVESTLKEVGEAVNLFLSALESFQGMTKSSLHSFSAWKMQRTLAILIVKA